MALLPIELNFKQGNLEVKSQEGQICISGFSAPSEACTFSDRLRDKLISLMSKMQWFIIPDKSISIQVKMSLPDHRQITEAIHNITCKLIREFPPVLEAHS